MDKYLKQWREENNSREKNLKRAHHIVRTIGSRTPEELDALAYNVIASLERAEESGQLTWNEDGSATLKFPKRPY
jgi:hypothetical protein